MSMFPFFNIVFVRMHNALMYFIFDYINQIEVKNINLVLVLVSIQFWLGAFVTFEFFFSSFF